MNMIANTLIDTCRTYLAHIFCLKTHSIKTKHAKNKSVLRSSLLGMINKRFVRAH